MQKKPLVSGYHMHRLHSRRTFASRCRHQKRSLAFVSEVHNCPCATNPSSGDALTHAFITSRPHIDALYKKVERGESDVVKKYKDEQKAVISSVAK